MRLVDPAGVGLLASGAVTPSPSRRSRLVGLLAIVLAGATGGQASESVAPEAPSFELAKGANEIGFWGGAALSVSTIGGLDRVETEGRRVGLLSFRYGRVLLRRDAFALEYFADLIPFAVETNTIVLANDGSDAFVRRTAYGAGMAPLGGRLVFRPASRVKPFIGISGGFLLFNEEVPLPGANKLAWTGDAEAGVQIWTERRSSFTLGLRFHHISNANTGDVNPGLTAFVFFAGFSLFR